MDNNKDKYFNYNLIGYNKILYQNVDINKINKYKK